MIQYTHYPKVFALLNSFVWRRFLATFALLIDLIHGNQWFCVKINPLQMLNTQTLTWLVCIILVFGIFKYQNNITEPQILIFQLTSLPFCHRMIHDIIEYFLSSNSNSGEYSPLLNLCLIVEVVFVRYVNNCTDIHVFKWRPWIKIISVHSFRPTFMTHGVIQGPTFIFFWPVWLFKGRITMIVYTLFKRYKGPRMVISGIIWYVIVVYTNLIKQITIECCIMCTYTFSR